MDARRRGKGRCTPPLEKICGGRGLFPHVYFFPYVENVLDLSPLTKISRGAHIFAARVVLNNNVALAEFQRNCEKQLMLIHIGAHLHIMLRKSIKSNDVNHCTLISIVSIFSKNLLILKNILTQL